MGRDTTRKLVDVYLVGLAAQVNQGRVFESWKQTNELSGSCGEREAEFLG